MEKRTNERRAKDILQGAGFNVRFKGYYLLVLVDGMTIAKLRCSSGTVATSEVERLSKLAKEMGT